MYPNYKIKRNEFNSPTPNEPFGIFIVVIKFVVELNQVYGHKKLLETHLNTLKCMKDLKLN